MTGDELSIITRQTLSCLPHVRRSIGHCCLDAAVPIHLRRQCMWKTWLHSPHTVPQIYQLSSCWGDACRLTQRTIISRYFARWATALICDATYTTHISIAVFVIIVLGLISNSFLLSVWIRARSCVPLPLRYGMPTLHCHFHGFTSGERVDEFVLHY